MFYGSDPAGQGYAPFAYAGNNPVIFTDPTGEIFGVDDIIITGAVLGGIWGAASSKPGELWYQNLWKGAALGGTGSFLGSFNHSNIFMNIYSGMIQGGIVGGLRDVLYNGNGSGISTGMVMGGLFAGFESLIQYSKNAVSGYGFRSNQSVADEMESELGIGNTNNYTYQQAIDYVKNRWNLKGEFEYDENLWHFGMTDPKGKMFIGQNSFSNDYPGFLRYTMSHEEGHYYFENILNIRGSVKKEVERLTKEVGLTWTEIKLLLKDKFFGYQNSIESSGYLQVDSKVLYRKYIGTESYINPLIKNYSKSSIYFYNISRRFR